MNDLRNPRQQDVDELPVHEDFDAAVKNLGEDLLFKVGCADSSLAHESNEYDQLVCLFHERLLFGTVEFLQQLFDSRNLLC